MPLEKEFRNDVSFLRNLVVEQIVLPPLQRNDITELLLIVEDHGWEVENGTDDMLYTLTNGHPYRIHYFLLQTLRNYGKVNIQGLKTVDSNTTTKAFLDVVLKDDLEETALPGDVIDFKKSFQKNEVPILNIEHYYEKGDNKMTKIDQTFKDSSVHGNVNAVVAKSIQDSFNVIEKADIKENLKEHLKQLTQAVGEMIKELPGEKAEEVAEDMKVLVEQATKQKPNPKWYTVSIDGLVAAAQNLGKVGDAVIELTGKVRKILAGGLI
jgi:hypothetical protein